MKNEKGPKDDDQIDITPLDFFDAKLPDFIKDPMEKIEAWANITLPEEARKNFLDMLKAEREQL